MLETGGGVGEQGRRMRWEKEAWSSSEGVGDLEFALVGSFSSSGERGAEEECMRTGDERERCMEIIMRPWRWWTATKTLKQRLNATEYGFSRIVPGHDFERLVRVADSGQDGVFGQQCQVGGTILCGRRRDRVIGVEAGEGKRVEWRGRRKGRGR